MELSLIPAYYPLVLLILGTILNSLTFYTLSRPSFQRDKRKLATIHYLRAIAIFDILMFYDWNLDHFLFHVYGFTILRSSIPSCKFAMFFGYFTSQSSAWLRVFVCFDRYLLISRLHLTWFSHSRTALMMILGIIIFFALFNFHFILFNCYRQADGFINIDAQLYSILPLWDYIHLSFYNGIPFVLMLICNSGVIYHLVRLRDRTMVRNSHIRYRAISITLIVTTFLFLLMTTPASICYALFSTNTYPRLVRFVDAFLFSYHITSFPLYCLIFQDFRREFLKCIKCQNHRRQIAQIIHSNSSSTEPRIRSSFRVTLFLRKCLSMVLFRFRHVS